MPGETWSGVFKALAPTAKECRAFLMAVYLVGNKDVLVLFGYDERSTFTADDRKALGIPIVVAQFALYVCPHPQ